LNPGMTWISELHRLYWNMADLWEKDPEGLEATGAGFKSRCKPCGTGQERLPPGCGSMPALQTKC
jgi:hypothetical protein